MTKRSKAEIEAEKKAKLERKLERERKKAEKEAKAKAREQKKAEKEAKLKAKADAVAAEELQKKEDAKVQSFIDKLKIDTKLYCPAKPMTAKEKTMVKKCVTYSELKLSRCYQNVGSLDFHLLNWSTNEFIISIENIYYFYNKEKNTGINFGPVFDTWLNTDEKNKLVFTEPVLSKVNIIKEPVKKVVASEEQKKAILKKMRGKK